MMIPPKAPPNLPNQLDLTPPPPPHADDEYSDDEYDSPVVSTEGEDSQGNPGRFHRRMEVGEVICRSQGYYDTQNLGFDQYASDGEPSTHFTDRNSQD